jgi:Protein of unknown function (DUF1360)
MPIPLDTRRRDFAAGRYDDVHELAPYAALGSTFTSAFAAILALGLRRLPERFSVGDLALLSIATHKLSRLLARDRVTRPLRAPFTEVQDDRSARDMKERPRGRGLKRAIAELLSCPFCLDQWLAGAFVGGLVFAPCATRATASMFAVVTGSDFLQHAQSWLRAHA